MLTLNVDIFDGLVNGAVGNLQHIEYDEDAFPKRLWLRLDSSTTGRIARLKAEMLHRSVGRALRPHCVPIDLRFFTMTLEHKSGVSCRRTQFPVIQVAAITIHKSKVYPQLGRLGLRQSAPTEARLRRAQSRYQPGGAPPYERHAEFHVSPRQD